MVEASGFLRGACHSAVVLFQHTNVSQFEGKTTIAPKIQKISKEVFWGLKVKWMCVRQNSLFHLTSRTMIQTEGEKIDGTS